MFPSRWDFAWIPKVEIVWCAMVFLLKRCMYTPRCYNRLRAADEGILLERKTNSGEGSGGSRRCIEKERGEGREKARSTERRHSRAPSPQRALLCRSGLVHSTSSSVRARPVQERVASAIYLASYLSYASSSSSMHLSRTFYYLAIYNTITSTDYVTTSTYTVKKFWNIFETGRINDFSNKNW